MATTGLMLSLSHMESVVRMAPSVDLSSAKVGLEEGFILSRVDGSSTVNTICQISGMGAEATLKALGNLRQMGLILLGDERPGQHRPRETQTRIPVRPPDESGDGIQINTRIRKRIQRHYDRLERMNFFELLDVEPTMDFKKIRRAYLERTKEFHPDKYFSLELGSYDEMIKEIFKQIRRAYTFLDNEAQRESYIAALRARKAGHGPPQVAVQRAVKKPPSPPAKPARRWHNEEVVSRSEEVSSDDGGSYHFVRRKQSD